MHTPKVGDIYYSHYHEEHFLITETDPVYDTTGQKACRFLVLETGKYQIMFTSAIQRTASKVA